MNRTQCVLHIPYRSTIQATTEHGEKDEYHKYDQNSPGECTINS